MKKLLILSALLFSPLFALPIGNPMDASLYSNSLFWGDCGGNQCCNPCDPCFSWCEAWSLRFGFYGDYVFDRHMKQNDGITDVRDNTPASNYMINTNAGLIALNLCNRVDLFATLGASVTQYGGTRYATLQGTSPLPTYVQTRTSFAWSVGGRLTLWDCDCFNFGLEGQYASSHQPLQQVTTALGNSFGNPYDVHLNYSEWQVGLGVAYLVQVGCSGVSFIPYTGVKWAHAKGTWSGTEDVPIAEYQLFDLRNRKHWGWALGATLLFCDVASLSLEGRFADEKAVSVVGEFRF